MHVVSTEGVSTDERFEFWHEVSARTWVPYDLRCEPQSEDRFQARMKIVDLGPVQVALMTSTPYEIHRTAKLIRQTDPELCKLGIAVRGAGTATQGDRQSEFSAGDLVLYDTSRPYSAALAADTPYSQLLVLRFPRSLLPLPPRHLRNLIAVRIPGTQGVGSLASGFLLQLARNMDEYSPADAARLSSIALDVLAVALGHELDAEDSVPPPAHHRALLAQIHAFIQQNLGDPELSPGSIAMAHHISLRYLHKLFNEQGRTVGGWIRERRLERCRRDLADPLFADQPVSAIAARWGFTSAAHFSQAFRNTYDLSPRQFKEQHAITRHTTVHGG
jgi:AraC-like DNA-binding protein